jgi:isoamylase
LSRWSVGAGGPTRYDGSGTNFAVFSEVAECVELCLFDDDGTETRIRLPEVDGFVWHGFLPSVDPGQRYGYRVYGPHDPAAGQRCNPNKLLVDPYAKAIDGDSQPVWTAFHCDAQNGGSFGRPNSALSSVPVDSRCLVRGGPLTALKLARSGWGGTASRRRRG